MSELVRTVTDAGFQQDVLRSSRPVLLDFWATWCGPCKALKPVMEDVARTYAGRVTVATMNIEENQTVASEFGIQSIPTLLLFDGGKVVGHLVGARPKDQIAALLDRALENRAAPTAR